MGKSTVAKVLRRMGLPVHDADKTVHDLQAAGGQAVAAIEQSFPGTTGPQGIDRASLRKLAYGNPAVLAELETILHPLVKAAENRFLKACARRQVATAVLDIPLLFETGGETRCDLVGVVSAPAFVQRGRVLGRSTMTAATLQAILARQMPDAEKCRRADVVIPTGLGRADALPAIRRLVALARQHPGGAWPPNPYRMRRPTRL